MATSFNRKNIASRRLGSGHSRDTAENGGGAVTNYYPLDPSLFTTVIITHHADDTPLLSLTNTLDDNDDLEHANVLWAQVYAGDATPYSGIQESGFTGMKITVTPTNGDVEISISQTRK